MKAIHTLEHAQQMGEYIQKLCREVFRQYNAQEEFNFKIDSHKEEGEPYHTVAFSWCAVDVGFPVPQKSVLGDTEIPGYHVWTLQWQSPASSWELINCDLDTLYEGLVFNAAATAVLVEFLRHRLLMVQDRDAAIAMTV